MTFSINVAPTIRVHKHVLNGFQDEFIVVSLMAKNSKLASSSLTTFILSKPDLGLSRGQRRPVKHPHAEM